MSTSTIKEADTQHLTCQENKNVAGYETKHAVPPGPRIGDGDRNGLCGEKEVEYGDGCGLQHRYKNAPPLGGRRKWW
jgi:hypothetical protein